MSRPPLPSPVSSSDTYDASPDGARQWSGQKSHDSLSTLPPPIPLSSKPILPPRPSISRFATAQNHQIDAGSTAPMFSVTHESSPSTPPRLPPRANPARATHAGPPQAHTAGPEEMGKSNTTRTTHELGNNSADEAESAVCDIRARCDLEISATTQLSKLMQDLEVRVEDTRQREGRTDTQSLFAKSDRPPHLTPSPNGNFYTTSSLPFDGNFDHSNEYFVGKECPNEETLSYGAFWFQNKDVPDFSICSRCFESHIRRTVFEDSFSCSVIPADDQAARCMFGVPRMLRLLWPQAVASNSLEDVIAYMRARTSMPHCHGPSGVAGSASKRVKWFQAKDNSLTGFVCCETCYNAYIVGSSFENNFLPSRTSQGPNDTWACDISIPYLNKAVSEYSRTDRWYAFIKTATKRLSTQPCAGTSSVKAHTRKWYRCKDVMICETCYLDTMAFTMFDKDFSMMNVEAQEHELDIICDLALLSTRLSLAAALIDSNPALFWNTIESQRVAPMCTKIGITGGTWYTLKGGCENFEICQTCYTGLVSAFGLEQLFELQLERPPDQTSVCDFCPDAPRFKDYMVRYNIALNTPTKELFTTFVKRIAPIPLCRGSESYQAQWYSFQVANSDVPMHVCRSCFEQVIRYRPLEHIFRLGQISTTAMCELYSANMRSRWSELNTASAQAAPNCSDATTPIPLCTSATADFTSYRNHRMAIYNQTIPQIKQLSRAVEYRIFQQTRLNNQSSFYTNLDRTTAAAQGINYGPISQSTTMFGNSSLGYNWQTPWGINGAIYGQQASAMSASNNADFIRMASLEDLWNQFE